MPERHSSLAGLFEHSLELLSEEERIVLIKLSIFIGGFDKEGAAQVAKAPLAILASLVEKSLVNSDLTGHYGLHTLVRRFALDKLRASDFIKSCSDDYCQYFARRAEKLRQMLTSDPSVLKNIMKEYYDIQAALGWSMQNQKVELTRSLADLLTYFWKAMGYL
jgi:predicted ATPase